MNSTVIETYIQTLDGMVIAMQQSASAYGRTKLEREVCDLLREARGKLREELERRPVAVTTVTEEGKPA